MTEDLYADPEVCQAILMDYYKNPRCAGVCEPASHAAEATNPSCGDIVRLSFQIADDRILQARTTGAGCAVSQAAASLMVEQLEGKSLMEASCLLKDYEKLLSRTGGNAAVLDRLLALRMIAANPARVRCARVAGEAAGRALRLA